MKTSNMGSLYKLTYHVTLKDNAEEKTFLDELKMCIRDRSGIGMAVSIIGMIVLCFVYSNLNGLFAVMMPNGVQ